MQLFSCLTWPCMLTFNSFCTLLSISHTSVGPTQPTPSNIDTFVHPYWTCVLANYTYTVSELLVECSLIDGLECCWSFRLADKMLQMHCIRPCSETLGLGWNFLGVTLGPLGVQCMILYRVCTFLALTQSKKHCSQEQVVLLFQQCIPYTRASVCLSCMAFHLDFIGLVSPVLTHLYSDLVVPCYGHHHS